MKLPDRISKIYVTHIMKMELNESWFSKEGYLIRGDVKTLPRQLSSIFQLWIHYNCSSSIINELNLPNLDKIINEIHSFRFDPTTSNTFFHIYMEELICSDVANYHYMAVVQIYEIVCMYQLIMDKPTTLFERICLLLEDMISTTNSGDVFLYDSNTHAMIVAKVKGQYYIFNSAQFRYHDFGVCIDDHANMINIALKIDKIPDIFFDTKLHWNDYSTEKLYAKILQLKPCRKSYTEISKKDIVSIRSLRIAADTEGNLFAIPQMSGTCTYYSTMFYIIFTLFKDGISLKEMADYWNQIYDRVISLIGITKPFDSMFDRSKALSFVHLHKLENTPTKHEIHEQYRRRERELYKTLFVPLPELSTQSSPVLRSTHTLYWDITLDETNWYQPIMNMKNVKVSTLAVYQVYILHYLQKIRHFWQEFGDITKEQFWNVFNFLEFMINLYSTLNEDFMKFEARVLSMIFSSKWEPFLKKHVLHEKAIQKWDGIPTIRINTIMDYIDVLGNEIVALGLQINLTPTQNCYELIIKWHIISLVLRKEKYPKYQLCHIPHFLPGHYQTYYREVNTPLTYPIDDWSTFQKNIVDKHECMHFRELSMTLDNFLSYRTLVRNHLCHVRFATIPSDELENVLRYCSHHQVPLQIELNMEKDDRIIKQFDEDRFYKYCWAMLMCEENNQVLPQGIDKYVSTIMRPLKVSHVYQKEILYHVHDKKNHLSWFTHSIYPYDTQQKVYVKPIGGSGQYQAADKHNKLITKHDYCYYYYKDYPCYNLPATHVIFSMVNALRDMATVNVYCTTNRVVIDITPHWSTPNPNIPTYQWHKDKGNSYWELKGTEWRYYEQYKSRKLNGWMAHHQSLGCIVALRSTQTKSKYALLVVSSFQREVYSGFWASKSITSKNFKLYSIIPLINHVPYCTNVETMTSFYYTAVSLMITYEDKVTELMNIYDVRKSYHQNTFMLNYMDVRKHLLIYSSNLPSIWINYWNNYYDNQKNKLISPKDIWYAKGGLVPRNEQPKIISNLVENKTSCLRQFLMGSGKSSVIIPHIILHYIEIFSNKLQSLPADDRTYFTIILLAPTHLQQSSLQNLLKLSFIPNVCVTNDYKPRLPFSRINIYVLTDVEFKIMWLIYKGKIQVNVLFIDEYDTMCMPCKSDYNKCSDIRQGPSVHDNQHPELLYWLQHKAPHLFIKKLPLQKITWEEWRTMVNDEPLINKFESRFKDWWFVYNSCISWNFQVDFGFRLYGSHKTSFVVPYITTHIYHPTSEFGSNDVRYIATCIALRRQGKLLPPQQYIYQDHISRLQRLGISAHKNMLEDFVTHHVYYQLNYANKVNNVNMADILLKTQSNKDTDVYAFSGTIAVVNNDNLKINCVDKDPFFEKVDEMVDPSFHKKEFMESMVDDDHSLWSLFMAYDVFIDSCGFFKKRTQIDIIDNLHTQLKRPIVYINEHHVIMVYPTNIEYPDQSRDTNFPIDSDYPNYFFYFDHQHIIGTDVKHPIGLRVLVATNFSSKRYIVMQALYRIRGLHDPQNRHSIVFGADIGYTSFLKEIPAENLTTYYYQWKKNEVKELKVNRKYLDKQIEWGRKKLESNNWQINDSSLSTNAIVERDITVNIQTHSDQNQLTPDKTGMMIDIDSSTQKILNHKVHPSLFNRQTYISDFALTVMKSSNNRYQYELFSLHRKQVQVIIHLDELISIQSKLDYKHHRVFTMTGRSIFPNIDIIPTNMVVLPMLTNSPLINFRDMYLLYTQYQKSANYLFFTLQHIMETDCKLFEPILSIHQQGITSSILSTTQIQKYQKRLSRYDKIASIIHYMLSTIS